MDRLTETYRSAFLPTFMVVFGFSGLLGVCILLARYGLSINPVGLVAGVSVGAVLCLALTALAVYGFPLYVAPSGIRCYNFWGLYRTVAWGDIESARPFDLLVLRYLVVQAQGGDTIFVPLFLSNMQRFRESVKGYAGENNPLVRELEKGPV